MIKKIFGLLLSLVFLMPIDARATVYSGKCGGEGNGSNLTWSLDTKSGLLSIKGTGSMIVPLYKAEVPWYSYRSDIKNVVIYEGVTSIGKIAFIGCSELNSVYIPITVTSIGDEAFSGCTSLTSIIIPSSVTIIGARAFLDCSGLTSISIPEGVTSIGEGAFGRCSTLTYAEYGSVESLCNIKFGSSTSNPLYYAHHLYINGKEATNIEIPFGVTNIGEYAFYECSELTSITIPESVTTIGTQAFYNCSGLNSITIPESVTSIGRNVFQNCKGILILNCDIPDYAEHPLIGSKFTSVKVNGKRVGYGEFSELTTITSVELGENVTSIGYRAFYKCTGLISISMSSGMTEIGEHAFEGCRNLTSITIPESVTTIGSEAFRECTSLASITIPESVTKIGYHILIGCTGINEPIYTSRFFIYLPKSYQGEYVIPETIETICVGAFGSCSSLTSVIIPTSVVTIGGAAFGGCTGLTSVTIPSSVKSIQGHAFSYCTNITSITIPATVIELGEGAFGNCTSLISIIIDGDGGKISNDAFVKVCPQYIELNVNLKNVIFDKSDLTEVKIGDNATEVYDLFSGSQKLKKVTLGKKVKVIHNEVFSLCTALDTVICRSAEPPSCEQNVFTGVFLNKCVLIAPEDSHSLYAKTYPWSGFGKIVGPIYHITYVVDGVTYKSYDMQAGESINPETEPTKEGYSFSGWIGLPKVMPSDNVTVTGSFTINQYSITYEVDGKTYTSKKQDYGTAILPPEMEEKEGYEFVWEEYPETLPANDITVKGQYVPKTYILTYMLDGEEYKSVEITYGTEIQPEEEPEREGYTFSGWDGQPVTMPAEDVTVTGSFTINSYKLTYMLDGEVYKENEIVYGTDITSEAEPTKEGYTFSGWSEIPETMPAHDVTITGSFTINSYKLTYMVDGKEYKTYTIEYGSSITPEDAPGKEGYTFSGWDGLPETMPAENVTVTGTFNINSYTLTYILDGEEFKAYTIEYGSSITAENTPEKEGYTFSGWEGLPEKMPAENVTVTGTFTINQYTITYIIDGEVFYTESIDYGSEIVPPSVPERSGYDFAWEDYPETVPANDVIIYGSYTTGIARIMVDRNVEGIYSMDGKRLSSPQHGVNIIRMKDGTVKRVMVK